MLLHLEILNDCYQQRKAKNPKYSLRAFSISLGLKPGRLSDMFNNRYGLSMSVAKDIVPRLGLSAEDAEKFLLSVEAAHARDLMSKSGARKKLKEMNQLSVDLELTPEQFEKINSWYHISIIEILRGNHLETVESLASRLGLSLDVATEAINELSDLGIVTQDKALKFNRDFFLSVKSNETHSDAMKSYHIQMIKKAGDALYSQDPVDREISNIQFMVNKNDLGQIKEMVKKFRRKIILDYSSLEDDAVLYSYNSQLFSLEKLEEDNE